MKRKKWVPNLVLWILGNSIKYYIENRNSIQYTHFSFLFFLICLNQTNTNIDTVLLYYVWWRTKIGSIAISPFEIPRRFYDLYHFHSITFRIPVLLSTVHRYITTFVFFVLSLFLFEYFTIVIDYGLCK